MACTQQINQMQRNGFMTVWGFESKPTACPFHFIPIKTMQKTTQVLHIKKKKKKKDIYYLDIQLIKILERNNIDKV